MRSALETETKQRSPTLPVPASAPQGHLPLARLLQHKRISRRFAAPPTSLAIVRKRLAARHALATPAGNLHGLFELLTREQQGARGAEAGWGKAAVADGSV